MYTIGDVVHPLNKYHTHEEVIHRKKRVSKKRQQSDKAYEEVDYMVVSSDKKETSEDEDVFCVTYDNV